MTAVATADRVSVIRAPDARLLMMEWRIREIRYLRSDEMLAATVAGDEIVTARR
jgi:hypothetical protein